MEDTQAFYEQWASTYDADVASQGYASAKRCADALVQFADDLTSPVLDVGCGTGLSGMALSKAGFQVIDGADISEPMLEQARERNIYRRLFLHDFSEPVQIEAGRTAHAVAAGVINPGHADPSAIDNLLAVLPGGGLFAFSLNDHALEDPRFEGRVHAHVDSGNAEVLMREYGEHMPGLDLRSVIYLLRKRSTV